VTASPLPEPAVIAAAKALHNTVFNADQGGYSACPCTDREEHDEKWHAAVVDARRALAAAVPAIRAGAHDGLAGIETGLNPDFWGRIVRALWVDWALGQPDPKPSWLLPWDELDDGQREADGRIGVAVAAAARDDERQRLRRDPVAEHARQLLASHDLREVVRADPPCSRDDAMTAIGGLIGAMRMLLKLIGDGQ
jgi:hypothetical protein